MLFIVSNKTLGFLLEEEIQFEKYADLDFLTKNY